jgi:hypothetical protein
MGAIGYLVTIELLGSAIRPRGSTPSGKNAFYKCLDVFWPPTVPKTRDDVETLYALRCSFAHSYGLVSGAPNKRVFRLVDDPSAPMINLRAPWGGGYPVNSREKTIINVRAVGDLVEDIYRDLLTRPTGSLEIVPSSEEEFRARFTFRLRS